MTEEGVTIKPGSIGSSSEGVVRLVLLHEAELEKVILRLQGCAKLRDENGKERVVQLADSRYTPECILWMQGKLEEILSKNLQLSHYNVGDMNSKSLRMGWLFADELWLGWGTFGLGEGKRGVERYVELVNTYVNHLDLIMPHALDKGIRDLLMKTHSETTMRTDQRVSELSEKKGLLGGLLGRG